MTGQADRATLDDVRRSDVRLTLATRVRRVAAAPGSRWWAAFEGVGLDLEAIGACRPDDPPDLVIAPAALAQQAVRTGGRAVVIDGRAPAGPLRAAGYGVRRLLVLPSVDAPEVVVPVGDGAVLRYVLESWVAPDRRWKAARNALLGRLLPAGVPVPGLSLLTVGERETGPPVLVARATELGVAPAARWFLAVSQGDALSRGVLHLFPADASEPEWVLKFARVAGYDYPVERDRRGLSLAEHAGARTAAHAPRFLGRLEVDGLHASLETAAIGKRLPSFLGSAAPRAAKLAKIDQIASWVVDVARETRADPAALTTERARVAADVVPRWGLDGDIVARLDAVPAVLAHNDLGTWNLVVSRGAFTALDWESAVEHGFPLWDLAYFLADASFQLDRPATGLGRAEHLVRLFRGELPSSQGVFVHLRRAVAALELAPGAVAPLLTLGWLHHGLSHVGRDVRLSHHAPGMGFASDEFDRMARLWLDDPALGPSWSAWRA